MVSKLSFDAMQGYRAFCNKIWNATRFAMMNFEGYVPGPHGSERAISEGASLADRWIRARLDKTVATVEQAMRDYQFSDASLAIYHFFWNELCDWYLELSKPQLREPANDAEKRSAQDTLVYIGQRKKSASRARSASCVSNSSVWRRSSALHRSWKKLRRK